VDGGKNRQRKGGFGEKRVLFTVQSLGTRYCVLYLLYILKKRICETLFYCALFILATRRIKAVKGLNSLGFCKQFSKET
jgi:hypothetical protein